MYSLAAISINNLDRVNHRESFNISTSPDSLAMNGPVRHFDWLAQDLV